MSDLTIGYIGLDHLHRDPCLALIDRLPTALVCSCEPNEAWDLDELRPGEDRPDEVDLGDVDIPGMLGAVPLYRDPEAMLDEESVDAVWLTLPNRDAPAVIEAAIDRGVDVITEKPAARTADELAPLAEAARERGVTVGANYFYRRHPIAMDLRDLVRDGFFGSLQAVDARYLGSTLDFRDPEHFIYDAGASRGGALQWLGVHWVDLFLWILDDPIVRVAASTTSTYPGVDVEIGATVGFETASGASGSYVTGYYLEETAKDSSFQVFGDGGAARTTIGRSDGVPLDLHGYGDDWMGAPHRRYEYDFAYDRFPVWGDAVLDFYAEMVDAIARGGEPPADIDDAVAVLRVLDAAYESAETGRWVETGL